MKRNKLISVYDRLLRNAMVYNMSSWLPLYIVTEHPKSGGSWFAQMLSDYLMIPFPRNRIPKITSSVMHGHYLFSERFHNSFVVIRDGRDVMVSWYHHCFFINDRYNERLVNRMTKALSFNDIYDVESNLPVFMQYVFDTKKPLGFDWGQFVDSWDNTGACTVRYENMLDNCMAEMMRALSEIPGIAIDKNRLSQIVDRYSFNRQSGGREVGAEHKKSFLRKGIAGDWKNYFNTEAKELFDEHAGNQLLKLGYVDNRDWLSHG